MPNFGRSNITQLKGNRLQIYNRCELANGWWTARTRKTNARGYYTKSLKTTDKGFAIVSAEVWFDELKLKIGMGYVPVSKSVSQICDIYLKQLSDEVARGDRIQSNLNDYKVVVEKFIRPYFGSKKIDTIRTKDVDNFIAWRQGYYVTGPGSQQQYVTYVRAGKTIKRPSRKPTSASSSALGNLKAALRGVFSTAVRGDSMLEAQVPQINISFKRTKARKTNKRPAFSKADYDVITNKMKQWVKQKNLTQAASDRRLLVRDYFLFLTASGLRPGSETDNLKWQHITFEKYKDGTKYPSLKVDGKTGNREVSAMPRGVTYLKRIEDRQQQRTGNKPDPSQAVFSTPDGKQVKHDSLRQTFGRMLKDIGIIEDAEGNKYSPYSCRHTYATFRLINAEIPITLLAQNMGTSVDMIEKHYGHLDVRKMADLYAKVFAAAKAESITSSGLKSWIIGKGDVGNYLWRAAQMRDQNVNQCAAPFFDHGCDNVAGGSEVCGSGNNAKQFRKTGFNPANRRKDHKHAQNRNDQAVAYRDDRGQCSAFQQWQRQQRGP